MVIGVVDRVTIRYSFNERTAELSDDCHNPGDGRGYQEGEIGDMLMAVLKQCGHSDHQIKMMIKSIGARLCRSKKRN